MFFFYYQGSHVGFSTFGFIFLYLEEKVQIIMIHDFRVKICAHTVKTLHCVLYILSCRHFSLSLHLPQQTDGASIEATLYEVILDDDISDRIKNKLYVLGVCGTSEVCVDLLCVLSSVQILKLALDVGCCLLVCVSSWTSYNRDESKICGIFITVQKFGVRDIYIFYFQ